MLGDKVMDLMVLCLVFLPLILFFIALLTKRKGSRFVVVVSASFSILCTLIMCINPNIIDVSIPSLIWEIFSLITVIFVFFCSVRDKQYIISVFTFIQALVLILFEIVSSPIKPDPFLSFNFNEKLLLVCGAVISIFFIPFIIYFSKKYGNYSPDKFNAGFVLLLSSCAGLISAKSMLGLFLFWQWQYLSGYFLLKSYKQGQSKKTTLEIIPYLQQASLTLLLLLSVVAFKLTGSLAMQDFANGLGKISELAALVVFVSSVLMGLLIPENYITWFDSSKVMPMAGLYLIIVSLIVPYGVLQKFRPFFHTIDSGVISLMILYGSLLVFAGAYFALLYYKNRHSLLSMIMSISGLAVATVFKDLQPGMVFLTSNPLPLLLVIAGIVLAVAYIIMWISSLFTHAGKAQEAADYQVISSFIPFNINFSLLIKISYITTAALALGVSLSCLK